MSVFDAGFAVVQAAVAGGRIPGAVLGLLDDGRVTVRAVGQAVVEPSLVAMRDETVFDLASLTKVIFTTTAILRLVEAGRIGLDDPLCVAIPDLRQYDVVLDASARLISTLPRFLAAVLRPLQNGLVQFYALGMVLGLAVFLTVVVFRSTR